MSDYISRADAIEAFERGRVYHKSGIEEIINALPSAVAVQGEWIEHKLWGNPWYTCSICNCHGRNDFNYCPNCGARMKGGDDE